MVKNKRMAGIAIIAVGLIMGLMAFILDMISGRSVTFSGMPLYLLLCGLMISALGAVYIGAGTAEAVRLLSKQVKILKNEVSEKERTIGDQKKNLELLSDSRLTGLSPTVDRLDILEKEKAAEAKPPEKPAEAPPKPAWEKKPDMLPKTVEKPHALPPPPPKAMVAPAPPKGMPLPPPPPKSMQAPGPHKPPEHHPPSPAATVHKPLEVLPPPKPVEVPLPPKPVVTAPVPVVPVAVTQPVTAFEPAVAQATVKPVAKPASELIDEEEEEEGDEENEDLLPKMTCPKCKNSFTGDWDTCPFCDFNLKVDPKVEPPQEPGPAATGGLTILGFTPKKPAEVPAPPTPVLPTPEPPKIPPVRNVEKPAEPARPVTPPVPTPDVKPAFATSIPPLPPLPKISSEPPAPEKPLVVQPPTPVSSVPTPPPMSAPASASKDKCSGCGKTVKPHWRNCPYCKNTLK